MRFQKVKPAPEDLLLRALGNLKEVYVTLSPESAAANLLGSAVMDIQESRLMIKRNHKNYFDYQIMRTTDSVVDLGERA